MQHRDERRGLGGIFFDDLNDYDQEMLLSFSTGKWCEKATCKFRIALESLFVAGIILCSSLDAYPRWGNTMSTV